MPMKKSSDQVGSNAKLIINDKYAHIMIFEIIIGRIIAFRYNVWLLQSIVISQMGTCF